MLAPMNLSQKIHRKKRKEKSGTNFQLPLLFQKIFSRFSQTNLLLLSSLFLAFLYADASAQSVTKLLEEILHPPSAVKKTSDDPSPAEQVPWVENQIAATQSDLDLFRSDSFAKRLTDAQLPTSRKNEFIRAAQERLEAWKSAKGVLDGIVAREGTGTQPQKLPTPSTPEQAEEAARRLDSLKEQILNLSYQHQTLSAVREQANYALALAKREHTDAKEEKNSENSPHALEQATLHELLATTKSQAAEAALFFCKWQDYKIASEETAMRTEADHIQEVLAKAGFGKVIDKSRALTQLEQLKTEVPKLEKKSFAAEAGFLDATEKLRALKEKNKTESDKSPSADWWMQHHGSILSTWEVLRSIGQARLLFTRQTESLWNRVLETSESWTLSELQKAQKETKKDLLSLEAAAVRIDGRLADARSEEEQINRIPSPESLSAPQKKALAERKEANKRAINELLALKKQLADLRSLQQKFTEELDESIASLRDKGTFGSLPNEIAETFSNIWHFPLMETSGQPLTTGTLLLSLAGIITAIILSRTIARQIASASQRRFKFAPSQSDLVEKLSFYAFVAFFVLTVLQWLSIPLTVFAYLGGALAVGIGFGSQNLVNNFISGILLLLERKIKVGDMVDVDGNFGTVINLGSRCSSIRKFDGVEVLVPNSLLLEKTVVNWTLSDPQHRYDFAVGVAYGSNLDEVFRTLEEAMKEQPEILPNPAPEVAFENFGASTLDFHLYFWLSLGQVNPRQISSELRRRIDRLCRERGIELAFPQRDVHLRLATPFPVSIEKKPGPTIAEPPL